MSGITLQNAQAILDKLVAAQLAGGAGAVGSFTLNGRAVTYRSADELLKQITYWSNMVAQLQRNSAGGSRFGRSRAVFGCN